MQASVMFRYASLAESKAWFDGLLWDDEDTDGIWFCREPEGDRPCVAFEETDYLDPIGLDGVYELPEEELHANPGELDSTRAAVTVFAGSVGPAAS